MEVNLNTQPAAQAFSLDTQESSTAQSIGTPLVQPDGAETLISLEPPSGTPSYGVTSVSGISKMTIAAAVDFIREQGQAAYEDLYEFEQYDWSVQSTNNDYKQYMEAAMNVYNGGMTHLNRAAAHIANFKNAYQHLISKVADKYPNSTANQQTALQGHDDNIFPAIQANAGTSVDLENVSDTLDFFMTQMGNGVDNSTDSMETVIKAMPKLKSAHKHDAELHSLSFMAGIMVSVGTGLTLGISMFELGGAIYAESQAGRSAFSTIVGSVKKNWKTWANTVNNASTNAGVDIGANVTRRTHQDYHEEGAHYNLRDSIGEGLADLYDSIDNKTTRSQLYDFGIRIMELERTFAEVSPNHAAYMVGQLDTTSEGEDYSFEISGSRLNRSNTYKYQDAWFNAMERQRDHYNKKWSTAQLAIARPERDDFYYAGSTFTIYKEGDGEMRRIESPVTGSDYRALRKAWETSTFG